MAGWYREDLAYIHDVGHAEFALRSAPGILEVLQENGIPEGLVVDLGCGSGLWARELLRAGYRVGSYGGYPLGENHAAFVARRP